mmetsp:Transcript_28445/g.65079  ORF Transcript_28445/g.65079 Transcript_28445/m.65079 type:complete len:82 (+) Transcript_28445:158-403(+)
MSIMCIFLHIFSAFIHLITKHLSLFQLYTFFPPRYYICASLNIFFHELFYISENHASIASYAGNVAALMGMARSTVGPNPR